MRRGCGCASILILIGALATVAAGQLGPAPPGGLARPGQRPAGFSDQSVEQAIQKGVEYLWSLQRDDGNWDGHGITPLNPEAGYPVGPTALVAYALLESGASPQDPRMERALKWLAKKDTNKTYSLGLRCNVWEIANRKTKNKYRRLLMKDVATLVTSTANGSYTYTSKGDGKSSGDNSNSQYGLLGVWAGARAHLEMDPAIMREYWKKVLTHWVGCQCGDGGWQYHKPEPGKLVAGKGTMTAAGVASLYVCMDNLNVGNFTKCKARSRTQVDVAIERGLKWFERNFANSVRGNPNGYYLYGVERVGLACGFKYFGTADWYKLGAQQLLKAQAANGSIVCGYGGHVGTSFALLFLVRGRNAVLFNKLQRTGDWRNRPRDLANLTRWLSTNFEKTVNWQIINLKVPVSEWHDAPILYLSGCKAPTFSADEMAKLREFVWQGGTIFSCAECAGSRFRRGIRKVYDELFPQYEMQKLDRNHLLYSVHFRLRRRPTFHMITNGVRPLVIHVDEDLPLEWQLSRYATRRWAFEAAGNVFMYVTDKGNLRPRGAQHWPNTPAAPPAAVVKLARLKYGGHWNPEPLALERFRCMMANRTGTGVEVLDGVDIKQLRASGATIAAMTGTASFELSGQQKQQLKDFATQGGTLVIDAAGGSEKFGKSAAALLEELFGYDNVTLLPMTSPIYNVSGMRIDKVRYRRAARKRFGRKAEPNLYAVLVGDRPAVLFSREDITTGLVGVEVYGCEGYAPESAFEIMRNIVLHAARGGSPKRAGSSAEKDDLSGDNGDQPGSKDDGTDKPRPKRW